MQRTANVVSVIHDSHESLTRSLGCAHLDLGLPVELRPGPVEVTRHRDRTLSSGSLRATILRQWEEGLRQGVDPVSERQQASDSIAL